MNLILFGFKASGKTHFGKLIARQLHRPFIDTDDLILELYAKETGHVRKMKEIYSKLGEAGFRSLEKRAIGTLAGVENAVIALGGGTLLDPNNLALLQKMGALVFLHASPEKLKERIFKEELPPFLDPKDPEKAFWQMIQERSPIYQSIPARRVDTDALDEAGVIAALNSILLLEEPPNGF